MGLKKPGESKQKLQCSVFIRHFILYTVIIKNNNNNAVHYSHKNKLKMCLNSKNHKPEFIIVHD